MNKDEILAKSKNEGLDEREQNVSLTSFGFANIIVAILCCIFVAINGIRGESYMEFIAIVSASQSATDFYKYKRLKEQKITLITAITSGVVAVLAFVMFIVKG